MGCSVKVPGAGNLLKNPGPVARLVLVSPVVQGLMLMITINSTRS